MDKHTHARLIQELIQQTEEFSEVSGITSHVIPKKGVLVQRSDWSPCWVDGEIVIEGNMYSVLPRSILPPRVIFKSEPSSIFKSLTYLEVKGYGLRGKEMFFWNHGSGDVFYGMYLERAEMEFERLEAAVYHGLRVPFPVAVVWIPKEEYITHGLPGFESTLESRLMFSLLGEETKEWISESLGVNLDEVFQQDDYAKVLAKEIVVWIKDHPAGAFEAIKVAMEKLYNSKEPEENLSDSAEALLSGKKVGYLMRAARSPIRVGDPSDKSIDTPNNQRVARKTGETFRSLLEIGFLHHCPGTGNWTIAGELTDLVDTFDLAYDREVMAEHMQTVGKPDMREFVEWLIGSDHTGVLSPYFQEGICGKPASLNEAVEEILSLIPIK